MEQGLPTVLLLYIFEFELCYFFFGICLLTVFTIWLLHPLFELYLYHMRDFLGFSLYSSSLRRFSLYSMALLILMCHHSTLLWYVWDKHNVLRHIIIPSGLYYLWWQALFLQSLWSSLSHFGRADDLPQLSYYPVFFCQLLWCLLFGQLSKMC